jgi:hypothetical protein
MKIEDNFDGGPSPQTNKIVLGTKFENLKFWYKSKIKINFASFTRGINF